MTKWKVLLVNMLIIGTFFFSVSYQLDISESLGRWAGLIGMLEGNSLDYVN